MEDIEPRTTPADSAAPQAQARWLRIILVVECALLVIAALGGLNGLWIAVLSTAGISHTIQYAIYSLVEQMQLPLLALICLGGPAVLLVGALSRTLRGSAGAATSRLAIGALGLAWLLLVLALGSVGFFPGAWRQLKTQDVGGHRYYLDTFRSIDTFAVVYRCDPSGLLCQEVARTGDIDLPDGLTLQVDPATGQATVGGAGVSQP